MRRKIVTKTENNNKTTVIKNRKGKSLKFKIEDILNYIKNIAS